MLAPTTPAGEEDDKNRCDHYCQTSTIFKDKTVKVNIIFTIAVITFIILALVILKVIGISITSDHIVEKNIPGAKSATPTLHFHCNSKSEKHLSS